MNAVTGALSYSGKYITRRLLALGEKVISLTGHPHRPNPFGDQVKLVPFNFDNPGEQTRSLQGIKTLYNTYWVRFPHGQVTFDKAVENTKKLIKAAEEAGVRRIVHFSITNASRESPSPYFRGKALVDEAIVQSRLSWAILRPTVIFGTEDILINNIAWLLRHFPVFVIPGSGDYRLQPVFVEDVAEMAVIAGHSDENILLDAVGPEIYTFNDLIKLISQKAHSKARIIHLKPGLALFLSRFVGYLVKDVVLTSDEVWGLMQSLLISKGPPTGKTRLSEWLEANSHSLGIKYASELERHYR